MRPTALLILIPFVLPAVVGAQTLGRAGTGMPPRLAVVDGTASFWRPGAADWTAARVNVPLASGDALHTGAETSVEIQIGAAAYLRTGAATYLELSDVGADQLQLKVVVGDVSLDLRELAAGFGVEVDTPQAALSIERPGYYRVYVDKRGTTAIVRRGGSAVATPGHAAAVTVRSSEEAVVTGDGRVQRFAAPDLDSWDRWSWARTDRLTDALSERWVPAGVYGLADLDQVGTWRQVDEFGAVWVPEAVWPGWTPFVDGDWLYDGTYGWTWVDDASWGWAPFHHGRWVSLDGVWAWAPGPPVVTPAYAPATVGWLGGETGVGWVALAWGEPLFPWWGSPGFAGTAWWGGWGGPWFVNRSPIEQRSTVYASSVTYVNAGVAGAVAVTRADRFGRGPRDYLRATPEEVAAMRPREDGAGVRPVAASLAPRTERMSKPPGDLATQRVVATRMPPDAGTRLREFGLKVPGTAVVQLVLPPPRSVPSLGDRPPEAASPRAGESAPPGEPAPVAGGDTERARPTKPPSFVEWWNGTESLAAAGRQVPRDIFEVPWSEGAAYTWRANRGFEPPMGVPYRTDLPGEPAMRIRPAGGETGFAAGRDARD